MDIDHTKDEHGRSLYPKMVYPKGNGEAGVVVNNPKEEMALMGTKAAPKKEEDKKPDTAPAWGDKK